MANVSEESREELHKAMAAAMRAKDQELHNRPKWDSAGRWVELAAAADAAAEQFRGQADTPKEVVAKKKKYKPLTRTRGGQVLCTAHATSGAPRFHTEGCEMCVEVRAKGVIRPNAGEFTKKQRRVAGIRSASNEVSFKKSRARMAKARKEMIRESHETLPERG